MRCSTCDDVLDLAMLLEEMEGDREAVTILLQIFLSEHCGDASLLESYLANGQLEDACRVAHSLKGVASSLEAKPLRKTAELIERSIKQEQPIAANVITQLREEIAALSVVITKYLQSGSTYGLELNQAVAVEKTVSTEANFSSKPVWKDGQYIKVEQDVQYDSDNAAMPPILNIEYLIRSMDDEPEAARLLLEIFIADHTDDATELAELVRVSAPDTICDTALRLVHSLKAVAGNIGAEALKQQVGAIEAKYKQQQVVDDDEYRRFERLHEKTIAEAKRYLAEKPTELA